MMTTPAKWEFVARGEPGKGLSVPDSDTVTHRLWVPGGWIYRTSRNEPGWATESSVFVPMPVPTKADSNVE